MPPLLLSGAPCYKNFHDTFTLPCAPHGLCVGRPAWSNTLSCRASPLVEHVTSNSSKPPVAVQVRFVSVLVACGLSHPESRNLRWDPRGPLAPLHAMNPLRARFVRDAVCRCYQ